MSRVLIPNSFQVQNLYVDELLCYLTANEWIVLTLAIREIIGWHDTIEDRRRRISLSTFIEGKARGRNSNGIWLSTNAVRAALRALDYYKILIKEGNPNQDGQMFYLQEDADLIDWNGLEARRRAKTEQRQDQTAAAATARTKEPEEGVSLDDTGVYRETIPRSIVRRSHGNPRKPTKETPVPTEQGGEHTGQIDDPFPGLTVYDERGYWGYRVDQVEEGEPTFRCPACDHQQLWPLKNPYRGLVCADPECAVPLAGFRPNENAPFWKPPKRPVEVLELGVLVPGCPKHLASLPYFKKDKDRLLHAMRKDRQRLWQAIEWAFGEGIPQGLKVQRALTAFYNPQTMIERAQKEAQREAAKDAKRDPISCNSGGATEMASAYPI